MAYSAPELLLVGAAQNLVLGASRDDIAFSCLNKGQEDVGFPALFYDSSGLW